MNNQDLQWHRSEGQLSYEPKTSCGKGGNPWWLILRCDEGIPEYYKWWVERRYGVQLERPLFGSHITIMRGEEPLVASATWKQREGEQVAIEYHHDIQSADGFWWLPVRCHAMEQLRLGFGLSPQPEHGFHLTLGRTRP